MKNLRKSYLKVKDNKGDKSMPRICKFYDEFDELFKKSPSVKPISFASSHNTKNLQTTDNDSDFNEDLSKHQLKKKKSRREKDTLIWLKILRDNAGKREAARNNRYE